MIVRDFIVRLARQFAGTFYLWGGAGPNRDGSFGFDCSGFIIFLLKPFGLLPERGDWTAQQLAAMFRKTAAPEPGDLTFYGLSEQRITHVMLYVGNGQVLGATGGDRRTKTPADARGRGAMVAAKPVGYRKDFVGHRNILAAAEPKKEG